MRIPCTLVVIVMSGFVARDGSANPSSQNPERPLAAHGTIEGAKQLVADLYELYNKEEQVVIKYFDSQDNPARWSDRQIAKSAGRLWKARRDAQHLKLMGEPAAIDLERKLYMLAIEIDKFGQSYRNTPKGAQLFTRIQTKLQRESTAMARFLEQAKGALTKGQLEVFATQMEKKGVELNEQLVFFSPSARQPFIGPFNSVLTSGDAALNRQRKTQYMETANAKLAEHLTAATEFTAEARRIVGEINSGGTATLSADRSGKPLEAFAHVVTLWQNASASLSRATAIQWAFTNRTQVQVQPTPEQLQSAALSALASIIEAAAKTTPTEDVQATYCELLKQISVADRRISFLSEAVFQACQPALDQLVAKAPGLADRIQRYGQATTEPLKWRREYANQQARNLKRSFLDASKLLTKQVPSSKEIRPNFVRQFNRESAVAGTMFFEPANWMVQEAALHLVGKPVTEYTMLRLSPNSKTAVVPFGSMHFTNVAVQVASDEEFLDLKSAILVDDQHGPLTRLSADAVSAAQMHDYLAVGGVIEQISLESTVTRFVVLPDLASPLIPLGKSPSLAEGDLPQSRTCWRLDVRPVWVHHRYFTVRPSQPL